MGVYTGTEDFKDKIVRHFMVSAIAGCCRAALTTG